MSAQHNIRALNISCIDDALEELRKVGVDPEGISIMVGKMQHLNIKVCNLDVRQANIIKQEMLSLGAEAAVHKNVITNNVNKTDTIIMATRKQLLRGIRKLNIQPFGLKKIADEISGILNIDSFSLKPITCGKKEFDFDEKIYIMGILNVTPDSFSDGGRFTDASDALKQVERMLSEGADIIDVGGESTRPGAQSVSSEEERKRVLGVIEEIKKRFDITVSVDTYKSEVAKAAIDSGADIINDISAMRFDENMKEVAAASGVPVILMHIKGRPGEMQKSPSYDCVISEITEYFVESIDDALAAGVNGDKIIIDPGIGFGKTLDHNVTIIKKLSEFKALKKPILMGLSRKSLIGAMLKKEVPDRLTGTIAANVVSVLNGANILRVHDVKEAVEAANIAKSLM